MMTHNRVHKTKVFPGGSAVKNLPAMRSRRRHGFDPPWVGGNPLQYSCLEHPLDRGAWQATDPRFAKSQT